MICKLIKQNVYPTTPYHTYKRPNRPLSQYQMCVCRILKNVKIISKFLLQILPNYINFQDTKTSAILFYN
jgi:hypothetical protein